MPHLLFPLSLMPANSLMRDSDDAGLKNQRSATIGIGMGRSAASRHEIGGDDGGGLKSGGNEGAGLESGGFTSARASLGREGGGADPPLVGTGSMAASGAATTTGLASRAVDPSLAGHVIGNNNDFGFGWVRSTTASYGSDGDNNGALWSNGSGGREVRDSVDKVSDAMDVDTLLLLLT